MLPCGDMSSIVASTILRSHSCVRRSCAIPAACRTSHSSAIAAAWCHHAGAWCHHVWAGCGTKLAVARCALRPIYVGATWARPRPIRLSLWSSPATHAAHRMRVRLASICCCSVHLLLQLLRLLLHLLRLLLHLHLLRLLYQLHLLLGRHLRSARHLLHQMQQILV